MAEQTKQRKCSCGRRKCPCEICHKPCGLNHSAKLPAGQLPTVANTNEHCPEEAFLPYLVGLPGMKGASMVLPIAALRTWSRRLWDGGARRVAEPVIFYHPPAAGELNPMMAAGEWKSTPPDPEANHGIDVDKLSNAMQAELARQLDAKRAGHAAPPKKPSARVSRVTRFNPDHHTVTEVLAHLRASSRNEAERVLDLEASGSKRAGILKRRAAILREVSQ